MPSSPCSACLLRPVASAHAMIPPRCCPYPGAPAGWLGAAVITPLTSREGAGLTRAGTRTGPAVRAGRSWAVLRRDSGDSERPPGARRPRRGHDGGPTPMPVLIGTSGWQYRDWRGGLYPAGVAQRRWLEHYASHYLTVENNNSFYRLPAAQTFAGWRARTPDDFVMAVKASRYLTHIRKVRDPAGPVAR